MSVSAQLLFYRLARTSTGDLMHHSLLATLMIAAEGGQAVLPPADAVCAPRCVQRVLQHYSLDVPDLTDLVVEVQTTVRAGAKFGALADALSKRGVYCQFARVNSLDVLCWEHPVILHLDGDHFAVMERCTGLSAQVWDVLVQPELDNSGSGGCEAGEWLVGAGEPGGAGFFDPTVLDRLG